MSVSQRASLTRVSHQQNEGTAWNSPHKINEPLLEQANALAPSSIPSSCFLWQLSYPFVTAQPVYPNLSSTTMSSTIVPPPKNFSGIVGAKRRRLRSGGNVPNLNNKTPEAALPNGGGASVIMEEGDTEKTAQTSKCKGATTIPIFLKSE